MRTVCLLLSAATVLAAPPRDALRFEAAAMPASFRLHIEFSGPAGGTVKMGKNLAIALTGDVSHDVAIERPSNGVPMLRVWSGGRLVRGPEEVPDLSIDGTKDFPDAGLDLGGDFTAFARFATTGNGTLFSKCPAEGDWAPDSKAVFIRDGHLVYDIGWLGAMSDNGKVNDGQPHTVVLVQRGTTARLLFDGKAVAEREGFTRPDGAAAVFKVGRAAPDFAGEFTGGTIEHVRVWRRALEDPQVALLFKDGGTGANTPDFEWAPAAADRRPRIEPAPGVAVTDAWVQPLERVDHAEIVATWDERSLAEGRQIYSTLCVVCHGTVDQPGSLPTALRFGEGAFKNGADPFSMYLTLTKGFGQMVPQPQFTTRQKYSVIQYIREEFLRPHNPSQLTEITVATLSALPKGLSRAEAEVAVQRQPPYQRMDFGPAMFWTLEVAPENIAYKGITVRLDDGPGGVSKGRAWMIYDHDTMRVAAATTGEFVDWKGIAFDGSHGTHTSLAGESHFVNPVGPGWASPAGRWDDDRLRGRDGKPYGPLPREWVRYQGLYLHGNQSVVAMSVGGTRVLESPGWLDYGTTPVFTRTLNVSTAMSPLRVRVAPDTVSAAIAGRGSLRREEGFWIAELPGNSQARLFISKADQPSLEALANTIVAPLDLSGLIQGGPPRWPQEVVTMSRPGSDGGAFVSDSFPLPDENPWSSWMRPGGFDFTPDRRAAMVATWNGDVWRVEGLTEPAPAALRWRRVATGLFQPLGVKFRGDDLFITCRDQLARLRDLNGDGETDFVECFNNDHQVTEHFHEFAMGLQTDAAGNFYYAKSARHALPALVPHHGTLLRVSADGERTDILATGFRAANGVCLNPDGTFFVTDQEGHWTPKNRINHVMPDGGFYGNIFGFTDVTDTADSAMREPLVWITNEKDRSPAELVWVPPGAWGPLGGSLLNLSYGYGRVYIVPHETVGAHMQGAVCELPIPDFPTGVMRGRFHSDGALYLCGMVGWATNCQADGGFYRLRYTGRPAFLPVALHARTGAVEITFSDELDPAAGGDASRYTARTWSIERSANYGSPHLDEQALAVTRATISPNGKSVVLETPDVRLTRGMEIVCRLRGRDGGEVMRSLHGTINELGAPPAPPQTSSAPGKLLLPGRETFTVADRPAFVFMPAESKRAQPQPWIFYAPTLPGYPDEAERWMHEQFTSAGIGVAGVDVGEAYGCPKSHAAFEALYRELIEKRGFASKACVFGRSRGGLWVSSWAIAHPERVAGLIGIYPVFDLRSYPGLEKAAPAYDLAPGDLAARLAEFNPVESLGRLATAGIPIALIHGDADTVVPLRENSAELVRRYDNAGSKGLVTLLVLKGQGHNFDEAFFHSQELVDFAIARARAGARP